MTIITYSILCLLSVLLSANVSADECTESCAYISPTTLPLTNRSCPNTGDILPIMDTINWSDGSSSDMIINIDRQLVIGSDISFSDYRTGSVTNGRFEGQNLTSVVNFQSVRQTCNDCVSNTGLSRVDGDSLLSIGTKGVAKWIECVGNVTVMYSPALTSTIQPTYRTFYANYVCNDCIESC